MVRFRFPTFALVVSLFAFPLACSAQGQTHEHERTVPAPVEPRPFPLVAASQTPVYSVEFRSADQLSQQDRLLLADSESTIAERAGFLGLGSQDSSWNYQEIVCPSFPNHLFLQYTRNNGENDRSVFSASIPRNGNGRIRIVPILRRSYSLFSPAPINALTISAFNHLRAEEGDAANSDWLGNALCYAALAGAHPQIRPWGTVPTPGKSTPALTAAMESSSQGHGQQVIRFGDAAALPRPMQWTMIFARNGKLIKATHQPASVLAAKAVPEKPAVIQTKQVPQTQP